MSGRKLDNENESLETYLQHLPIIELNEGNHPLATPIYQNVKFAFDEYKRVTKPQDGDYFYSRVSNPTVRQLEMALAKLQGREDAICVASGVATISSVFLTLLKSGDHVLYFAESYKPTRLLLKKLMSQFQVESTMMYLDELDDFERKIIPGKTRMVIFESPTNPVVRVADIGHIAEVSRRHGILSVLDNTFAGLHNHGQFYVDIYLQSLTKFASGHGDVMGGALIANHPIIDQIRGMIAEIGPVLDPHAAYLILRGLKTYFVRFERQNQTALQLAQWLETHPKILRVLYPGLKSHPQYELARRQMKQGGALIAIELKGGASELEKFMTRLRLFQVVGSVGSTESLAAPCSAFFGADLQADQLVRSGIKPTTVRLSIGLEDFSSLRSDLEYALS